MTQIIHAKDDAVVGKVLHDIAEAGFAFNRDTTFNSYLGILVENLPNGAKKLSQTGLTKQLLEMMGMLDCNPTKMPTAGQLQNYPDAEDHDGSFNC